MATVPPFDTHNGASYSVPGRILNAILPQLADERLAFVLAAALGEGLQQAGSSLRAADAQQRLTPVIAKAREKILPTGAARAVGSSCI